VQPPGPLAPTTTQTISGLYTETFVPSGTPKGAILITHGYAEHCGRYREVAHVLVDAGWAVMTYDVRGHGQSPGDRGFIERFDIYIDDLGHMIDAARALAPNKPFVLLGHSHGSLIVLRALTGDRPPNVTSAIVSSPYLAINPKHNVPGWQKALARVASRIAPKLKQPNNIVASQLTSDPAKQAEHAADKLNFATATPRWFVESSAAQAYVADHANRIQVPTTWLVGGADPLTDPARSEFVAKKVKGATYHDLAGMKHEVFNELERGKVFDELIRALPNA
jgi:lysophospholipase